MPKTLKWSRYKTRTFYKFFLVLFMDLVEITAMAPETSFHIPRNQVVFAGDSNNRGFHLFTVHNLPGTELNICASMVSVLSATH